MPVELVSKPATNLAAKLASDDKEREDLVQATRHGLSTLKGIEALGGLKGYQEWLTQPHEVLPAATVSHKYTIACCGEFWSAMVFRGMKLECPEHRCDGTGWGSGVCSVRGVGVLTFDDWDVLTSKEVRYSILKPVDIGSNDIQIAFFMDDKDVAEVFLGGGGLAQFIGTQGVARWTKI